MTTTASFYDVYMMTDINGQLRAKWLNKSKTQSSNGVLGFCDVVMGWDMFDQVYPEFIYSIYPDAWMKIDKDSKRTDSHGLNYWMLDFDLENSHCRKICPRTFLKKIVEKYAQKGISIKAAHELEWFVFDKATKQPIGRPADGYSLLKTLEYQNYINQILEESIQMGFPLEGMHPETGEGSWEATLIPTDALRCADNSVLFKHWVKKISLENDWIASFMAKWNVDKPGAGGHIHLSLWKEDENYFKNPEILHSFVAGVLKYVQDSMLVYAPNMNSYQRLVKGSWAPTTQSWGHENRTTALRYITGSDNQNPHIELRIPGADVNPYLALALFMQAGLDGIEKNLKPTEPLQKSAYESNAQLLTNTMEKSIENFKKSDWLVQAMGKELHQHYLNTRIVEYERTKSMNQDELFNRYLERL